MEKPEFLETTEYSEQQILELMNLGTTLKACVRAQYYPPLLRNQAVVLHLGNAPAPLGLALETAVWQLGGACVYIDWPLEPHDSLKRVASQLSDNCDCAIVACQKHETLLTLAKHAEVPIINAGSSYALPITELAALITMYERLPSGKKLEDCKAVFDGKASAFSASMLFVCSKIGMQFVQLCADKAHELQPPILKIAERNVKKSGGTYAVSDNAAEAYRNADFLFLDAPIGAKLPPEAAGVLRIDETENLLTAARAVLTCMLYRNPAAREPMLVEKMKRMLAIKLQAIFGFGEANE